MTSSARRSSGGVYARAKRGEGWRTSCAQCSVEIRMCLYPSTSFFKYYFCLFRFCYLLCSARFGHAVDARRAKVDCRRENENGSMAGAERDREKVEKFYGTSPGSRGCEGGLSGRREEQRGSIGVRRTFAEPPTINPRASRSTRRGGNERCLNISSR